MMTRKEALEVMRKNMPTDRSLPIYEALQTLIPELAESEDERVRKALIDGIRQIRCKNGVTQEQMLAWLEKQKSAKWSEEDENMLTGIIERGSSQIPFGELALRKEQLEWLMDRFKFLHFQSRDYAITFWTYLDEHRPEGKMCLSNGECADIEKAFIEHDWAKILRYAKKYRPSWKPSEEQMDWLELAVKLSIDKPHIHGIIISLYEQLKRL